MAAFKGRAGLREVCILAKLSQDHTVVCVWVWIWVLCGCAACLCVLPSIRPHSSNPRLPSGQRRWHGAGFEPASAALSNCRELPGPRSAQLRCAATAVPWRACPSLRLVYSKVFLITRPSLHSLSAFVCWVSFRSLFNPLLLLFLYPTITRTNLTLVCFLLCLLQHLS